MDLFARKNLGWPLSLRRPIGDKTFFKPRFLGIQRYRNPYRRRVSFRNRLFNSDFFLRSTCPPKLSNFWDGTGYCYVTTFKSDALVWFIVDRIEECLILRVTLSTTDPKHYFSSWLLLLEWDFLGHCIVWWQYKDRKHDRAICQRLRITF